MLTRIAPTPSGYLHIGNALSFLHTWLLARSQSGRILLRIDDLDNSRSRPEYLDDVFRTLEWLGIDWDMGPTSVSEFEERFSQRHRIPLYEQRYTQLEAAGVLYSCSCSRSQLQQRGLKGRYDGHCRQQPAGMEGTATRLLVPEQDICFEDLVLGMVCQPLWEEMGDFVVRRRDGIFAYQLASLADDLHFGVDFIVRGQDLLSSTAAQVLLARYLQAEPFLQARFFHHPLIMDTDGVHKLSKSAGAHSVRSLDTEASPAFVYRLFARQWGLPAQIDTLEGLLEAYRATHKK